MRGDIHSRLRATSLTGAIVATLLAGAGASTPAAAIDYSTITAMASAMAPAALPEGSTSRSRVTYTTPDASGRARYTVILAEPALADYRGQNPGFRQMPKVAGGSRAGRPDMQSAEALSWVGHLQQSQAAAMADFGQQLGRALQAEAQFQHALNAVVLRLTPDEAEALRQRADVRLVDRERLRPLRTFASPTFIGANTIWNGTNVPGGVGSKGEGVVVGELDTGINWASKSFKATGDDGYTHINPLGGTTFLGNCVAGKPDAGHCNAKLIGMYNMVNAAASGQDLQGHGSHTASTAAGTAVTSAAFSGGSFSVTGVAPHANIVAYLVCDTTGCPDAAIQGGVNQAVADNIIDVVNYSIGGPSPGPWLDATEQAFLGAHNAGIFVAAAAGNDGPTAATTENEEPWVTTVAATTPDKFPAYSFSLTAPGSPPANTQNLAVVQGSAPGPTQAYSNVPLIKSPGFANGSTDGCSAFTANTFRVGGTAAGAQGIAVLHLDGNASNCPSATRRTNALNAGAVATVFVDVGYLNLGASGSTYAMTMAQWNAINTYTPAANNSGATATISFPISPQNRQGDLMADFSSRGPGPNLVPNLKPDIAAPGDTILAAVSPTTATNYATVGANIYEPYSGTSMATPHIAGSAALLHAVKPAWTPMQIKSALMTTAKSAILQADGISPTTPQDIGAGRVDLTRAAKAGFVLDETGANFSAANPASNGHPEQLNIASFYHPDCVGTCSFPRVLQGTGGSGTWTVAVSGLPAGSFTITPASFPLAGSATQNVTLTVDATSGSLTKGQWYYGAVTFTSSDGSVPVARMPLAIRPATAKLASDTSALNVTLTAGTSTTRTVTVSNAGNPTLNWSIPTTTMKGRAMKRDPSTNGLYDATVVTAATSTAIASTNANNSYGAEWFDIYANGTTLAELQMDGFGYDGANFPPVNSFATQFAWRVYADNAGVPAGRPGIAADTQPVWQFPAAAGGLPPTATGLTFPGDGVRLDVAAAGAPNTALNAGRYWLNLAPSIVGTTNQFYQLLAQVPGKTPLGQIVTPNASGSPANKNWKTTATVAGDASYTGYAMEVVVNAVCSASWLSYDQSSGNLGLAGSAPVVVTLNATSLAAGTYKAYVCLNGNGTSPPFMGKGQDTLLIPVTLTVNAAVPTNPAGTGQASPNVAPITTTTLLTVAVTPGTNPTSTGITVNANLTSIGGSGTQALNDSGANGDVSAGDGTYSFLATVAASTTPGAKSLPVSIADAQARNGSTSIALTVPTPTNPAATNGLATPSTVPVTTSTLLTVDVAPGTNPASSGLAVTVDLTSIGGANNAAMHDDGLNGDATAGDGKYSYAANVPLGTAPGAKSLPVSVSDSLSRTASTNIALTVPTPTNPTGTGSATPNPVLQGDVAKFTITVTPGASPTSTGIGVTVNLSAIGGSAAAPMYDDGTHGDATPGDNVWTLDYTLPASTPLSTHYTLNALITDGQSRSGGATIDFDSGDRIFANGFE